MRFEYYHDNWLDVSNFVNDDPKLKINLQTEFFDSIRLDTESLKEYRISAARKLLPSLGDKPALCFSGGIDSQATWQCFNEANINIDVYTLVFKDNLNTQDVSHAFEFAEKHNIKIEVIEIDIINFLSRENADYGRKYKSLSPHFNTHYKLCDILSSKGYTGFVCGGGSPLLTPDVENWMSNYSQNFLNYINYSQATDKLCQGNFLGYDPYLAWAITLLTPLFKNKQYRKAFAQEDRDRLEHQRYLEKIKGYSAAGFKVIPQKKKYTGFELVKDRLEQIYGDGWAFEKMYRHPLKNVARQFEVSVDFDISIVEKITDLNLEYSRPSLDAPTGI